MASRLRIARYFSAMAVAAGILSTVRPGRASPLPRLVVTRAADAQDCPDAMALAAAVEQLMHRPALDTATENPTTTTVFEVRIAAAEHGYVATIQAGELTRDLSDPGSTCAELGEALALTLSILLDDEPSPPPPLPLPRTPPPFVLPRQTTKPIEVKVARLAKPFRDWNVGIDSGVADAFAFLSSQSFAILGNAWFRYHRASFGTGFFVVPTDRITIPGRGAVDAQLVTSTLDACGQVFGRYAGIHVSLCGQTFVGSVRGQGRGFPINRVGSGPWVGLGGTALVDGSIAGRFGWWLRAGLTIPVVSQGFTATYVQGSGANAVKTIVPLFNPEKTAGFVGVGLRVTIY